MFWHFDDETIPAQPTQLFELTEQVRSTDAWLVAVLTANRIGEESWEMYCFTHGFPTRHVGSWIPEMSSHIAAGSTAAGQGHLACQNADCQRLQDIIWPDMLRSVYIFYVSGQTYYIVVFLVTYLVRHFAQLLHRFYVSGQTLM